MISILSIFVLKVLNRHLDDGQYIIGFIELIIEAALIGSLIQQGC